jgi:hypothetical protein
MHFYHLPQHLKRKTLSHAMFGGLIALGTLIVAPVVASSLCGANPCAARKGKALVLAASCNPCNPCAAKKACGACNPCAAKKACGACNPCAAKKACGACNPCNPCAAKKGCGACNPCNPCAGAKVSAKQFTRPAGVKISTRIDPTLLAEGEKLWNDTNLSSNGLACGTCHKDNGALNASFAQDYPHKVAMPSQMAGVDKIYADEMAQFCLLVPMQSKTLAWNSRQLKALTTYTIALQRTFNPCAAKKAGGGACNPCNPCAAKKACGACNPCAAKKACGACNPCAAKKKNPCNPCNPCAAKKTNG